MYRVLLVEDDATLRFIYTQMKAWADCGFSITGQASNGRAALDLLKKQEFDLLFTDIRMPFMDGIELLRALKEDGSTLPCIFASSFNEFEYARQGLVLGAFDYLLKPVEPEALTKVLLRLKQHIEEKDPSEKLLTCVSSVLDELGVSANKDPFVYQIALYCSEHIYGEMRGEELAEAMNYSKNHFDNVFRQHIGIPYRDFFSRVKVTHGIELLRTGNYRAYEISEKLGYSSAYAFSKVFKSITGKTLMEYKSGMSDKED